MQGIRLQLVLAKAGVASRRAAEALITAGRVAVNGRVEKQLGSRVDPVSDTITVDGREVQREPPGYFLLNKPKGYVTTAADPEGRQTVFALLPAHSVRLFAVGRLDYNTEGALLLTNDGELAHALMHPSRGIAKTYQAKMRGHLSEDQLDKLRIGVLLPEARPLSSEGKVLQSQYPQPKTRPVRKERSAPCEITVLKQTGQHTWLEVVLHEGKNRQIHRMAEAIGSSLLKLQRISYAGLSIADLPIGEARPLARREIAELRRSVGLVASPPAPPLPKKSAAGKFAQESPPRSSATSKAPRTRTRPVEPEPARSNGPLSKMTRFAPEQSGRQSSRQNERPSERQSGRPARPAPARPLSEARRGRRPPTSPSYVPR